MIEEALVSLLSADPGVQSLLGSPPRLYPQQSPQSELLPATLYAADDPDQLMAADGSFLNLYWSNFRFDCYGGGQTKYASAKAVAAAVRAVLYGIMAGGAKTVGAGPGSVNVLGVFASGGEDGLEPPVHGDEHGYDYVGVQIKVCYSLN